MFAAATSVSGAAGEKESSPAEFLMKGMASTPEENALDVLLRLEEVAPALLLGFVSPMSDKASMHVVSTLSAFFTVGSATSDVGAADELEPTPAVLLMAPMPEETTLDMLLKLEEAAAPTPTFAFV